MCDDSKLSPNFCGSISLFPQSSSSYTVLGLIFHSDQTTCINKISMWDNEFKTYILKERKNSRTQTLIAAQENAQKPFRFIKLHFKFATNSPIKSLTVTTRAMYYHILFHNERFLPLRKILIPSETNCEVQPSFSLHVSLFAISFSPSMEMCLIPPHRFLVFKQIKLA